MAKVPKKGPNSGGHICRDGGESSSHTSHICTWIHIRMYNPYPHPPWLSSIKQFILHVLYIMFLFLTLWSVFFIDHKARFTCGSILLCSQLSCGKISCVLLGIAVILQCGYWSRVLFFLATWYTSAVWTEPYRVCEHDWFWRRSWVKSAFLSFK